MEKHAIANCYPDHRRFDLPWDSLLQQDIRKVPAQRLAHSWRSTGKRHSLTMSKSQKPSISSLSTEDRPDSTFSAQGGKSSVPTTPDVASSLSPSPVTNYKKRQLSSCIPVEEVAVESLCQAPTRYWNEFDDGDERDDEEGYFIYIEQPPLTVPGSMALTKCADFLSDAAHVCVQKARAVLGTDLKVSLAEREHLVREVPTSDTSDGGSDVECAGTRVRNGRAVRRDTRQYSTFAHSPPPDLSTQLRRRQVFSYIYTCLIATSTICLLVAAVLCANRPRKTHRSRFVGSDDFVILLCDLASLLFAFFGGTIILGPKTLFGLTTKMAFILFTWFIILCNCVIAASVW